MNVGSLFSGIGGFDLGLERAGFRTAWFCEQDEFCQHVLAKHWPGVPCYPDITELRGSDVEPVDVLCGGFPCQDLSYAGRGAGLAGARSGLWSEYARLIGELRPRYVLVENVSALLARGMGRVLGDLAALGYDAEWDCIPASAVGAPHRRDRIWLVAYPGGDDGGSRGAWGSSSGGAGEPVPVEALQDAAPGDLGDTDRAGLERHWRHDERADQRAARASGDQVADADQERRGGRAGELGPAGRGKPSDGGWWLVEPDVGRVAHGVPVRVDRLRSLGNALVPQIAEWIGRQVMAYENENREDVAA